MSDNLAPWRTPLAHALHRNRSQPHSRYFQVATVTPEGLPKNRTVVFRGFVDNSNKVKIITDLRSEKINQIQHQPWAEICWYFSKTREQFRLTGKLTLVTAEESDKNLQIERLKTWKTLSDAAKLQFSWPNPGQAPREDQAAFLSSLPSDESPLHNFCLLLLNPERVDHLQLQGSPQNRFLYHFCPPTTWTICQVNP